MGLWRGRLYLVRGRMPPPQRNNTSLLLLPSTTPAAAAAARSTGKTVAPCPLPPPNYSSHSHTRTLFTEHHHLFAQTVSRSLLLSPEFYQFSSRGSLATNTLRLSRLYQLRKHYLAERFFVSTLVAAELIHSCRFYIRVMPPPTHPKKKENK